MVRNERKVRRKKRNPQYKNLNDCSDKRPHFQRNEEGSVKTLKRFHDHQSTLKTKTAQAN